MCLILSRKETKKILKKKSRERYENPTEEEKNKKQEYGHEWYKNLSETEKQRLVEYRKRYYEMQNNNCKVAH